MNCPSCGVDRLRDAPESCVERRFHVSVTRVVEFDRHDERGLTRVELPREDEEYW